MNTMQNRQFARGFITAMLAYVIVLCVVIALVDANPGAWWRYPAILLPMIPALFVLQSVVRQIASMDELQRSLQLQALAFAFGGTAIITFSYGFLERVGFPTISMFFVWPVMAVLWLIGLTLANRKYQD